MGVPLKEAGLTIAFPQVDVHFDRFDDLAGEFLEVVPVVGGVVVHQGPHVVARRDELFNQVTANEAGSAGHQCSCGQVSLLASSGKRVRKRYQVPWR